jgi:conjugative relaxase-like TrwC/TraI family protein
MLTTMQIMSAVGVVAYFGRELSTSEYYTAEHGVWCGKGAERLGLPSELTKEDFVAIANNRIPQSGDRLTARTNDKRTHIVWELDEETQSRVPKEKEVNNRRVCVDFTFSVPKSVSMYLAKTKDEEVEKLIHRALRETMDDMEAAIQTRVRIGGADHDRVTGNAIWAKCIHRTTRPVSGRVDPHWHCHALLFNATYDEREGRWKAAQLGNVIANKGFYQAAFHSRIAEKLMEAGHRLRRTERDFEMDVFTHEEIRVFCKRTKQIERLERELRTQLETRTGAIVRAAAKRGEFVDYEEQYAAEKAKLGAEYREAKNKARLQGAALDADWGSQLAPGRWDAVTREASRAGASIGFLEPETAKARAISHAFEKHSVLKESLMIAEVLKWGIGKIPVLQAEAFVRKSSAFLRNPDKPGRITTAEVYAEDKRIIERVQAGKGAYQLIGLGKEWTIQSARVAGDQGQKNAVYHVLRTCDLLMGIEGKPGVGKTSTISEAAAAIRSLTGRDPVMLAPTARTVAKIREAGFGADTVANLRDKPAVQAAAAGRIIWCDEASALDNRDFDWLLQFVQRTGSRLVMSGDPKQHGAVQRGHPFKMLIDTGALECAKLEKIYRQQDVPKLLEIIEHYHGERYEAALNQIEELGIVRESDTRSDALTALVMDAMEEFRAGQTPIIIAPVHEDGKDFARAIREAMKGEGMLGAEDQEIARLESCDLSEAQKADPINYEVGQVIECHHRLKGDLRPGEQWEVTQVLPEAVVVTRSGREKFLPLCQSKDFNVYYRDTMPIAVSEHLLITKNNRGAHLRNGDMRLVQAIDGNTITLDNGYKLDASKPLHIRQGYTMTSQASQGHENLKMFAFLPVSATSQINAVQMLVSLSRASREVRLYTDSKAVLREAAIRPGQGASAIELIDGESNSEVDLWHIGHNGETTKEAEIIRKVQRSRRMMKREQICEVVRKTANREMGVESCIER